jgi:hypothetical protein
VEYEAKPVFNFFWDNIGAIGAGDVELHWLLYMCGSDIHVNIFLDKNLDHYTYTNIGEYIS